MKMKKFPGVAYTKNEWQADKSRATLQGVGQELKKNPPAVLEKTRRKKGAGQAEKQRKAILLSKARARGAKV